MKVILPNGAMGASEYDSELDAAMRTIAVHAHHDDYTKPLEVRWLCQKHHHEWHKTNKAIGCREVA